MAPRTRFGTTWWGRAWVEALEQSAALDPGRLSRGRTYARGGKVGSIDLHPGYASARVRGRQGRIYRTVVAVRSLGPAEWDQVAEAIASKSAHAAALFDGELSPAVVEDAAAVDIRLLPGAGDLRPDCSCPDWAEPCKHAAALCYLIATELDRDPFVLFLLRGMARDDLLQLVRARRGGPSQHQDPTESLGIDAKAAWEAKPFGGPLAPLPPQVASALANLPPRAVHPPSWDVQIPSGTSLTRAGIDALASDAAERAHSALADGTSLGLAAGIAGDLARRASSLDRHQLSELSIRLGMRPTQMAAHVEAWHLGGDAGVAMVADLDLWSTDQTALSAGREALVELGYSRRSVSLNYDSLRMRGSVWLAIGPDRRWYKFRERGQRRELHLADAPSHDICDLVDPPPASPTR